MADSSLGVGGHLELKKIIQGKRSVPVSVKARVNGLSSGSELSRLILAAIPHLCGSSRDPVLAEALLHRLENTLSVESHLHLKTLHADGRETDHGIVATNKSDLITTAGVNFLVGILTGTNATATAIMYHALGLGCQAITAVSVANPSQLTFAAAHNLVTGQTITISGTTTTPSINGAQVVTVVDATHVTIPVNVTAVTTGTGTAVATAHIAETIIQNELIAADYTGGVRASGTHVVGASNNIYQSVATNTIPSAGGTARAITELGFETSATLLAATLFDHFIFAAVNLSPGDSLQSTISVTFSAGG